MPKIAYVYEGIKPVAPQSKRAELINPKYFGGVYEGSKGIEKFWREIYDYIQSTYEVTKIKHIYINGDGASWIKGGRTWIAGATFVLDEFHMQKYIIAATSHLLDSAGDARGELYHAIHKKAKWMAVATFEKILRVTESDSQRRKVETSMSYILGHWNGIMQGATE